MCVNALPTSVVEQFINPSGTAGSAGKAVQAQSTSAPHAPAAVTAYEPPPKRIPETLWSALLPFQRQGVEYVVSHGGRALIADEMVSGLH